MKYSEQPAQPLNRYQRRRAAKLERMLNSDIAESDFLWGAEEIGQAIGRTAEQVYNMHRAGMFKTAVRKFGHRTISGSRQRILEVLLGE
jgi:hypothetical protein